MRWSCTELSYQLFNNDIEYTLISLIAKEVGINVESGIFWKKTSTYINGINEDLRVEKI